MARPLIVEDRLGYRDRLQHRLRQQRVLVLDAPPVFEPHRTVLSRGPGWLERFDLLLLDAYDTDSQQEDASASRFTSLEVLDRLSTVASPPTVIAYSTAMARPEVPVPLAEYPIVAACYEATSLLQHLDDALAGRYGASVPAPRLSDYDFLGVGPKARLSEAHARMRSRRDAWEQVWRRRPANVEQRTRQWINEAVGPLLDREFRNYKEIVSVIRRIAGLPTGLPGSHD